MCIPRHKNSIAVDGDRRNRCWGRARPRQTCRPVERAIAVEARGVGRLGTVEQGREHGILLFILLTEIL